MYTKKINTELDEQSLKEDWKEIKEMLYYQSLLYIQEIVKNKLISSDYNDLLVGYFRINKTPEVIIKKYYWPTLRRNIEVYVTSCDIFLVLKTIKYKIYNDLQSL